MSSGLCLFCKADHTQPITERFHHVCADPKHVHWILIVCNKHVWLVIDTAHAFAKPAFPYEKCIMSSELHWHLCVLQLLLCTKILVHHATAVKVLSGHAHFAVNALCWINIVIVADDGDCALSAY